MARPRKDGMDYFPHDVHMSTDKKIRALRIMHGNDGYAFYNITLEMIYQEPNFELDVSDAETMQILARNVEVTTQKLSEMIATAVKHRCFDPDLYHEHGVLTSNGIKKRASVVVDKRTKMQDSYEKKVSDAETIQKLEVSAPKVKESKSKVKEDIKPIVDSNECDDAFEKWYALYPKQGSVRKEAFAKWKTLWKERKIDLEKMMNGTNSYIQYQSSNGFRTCGAQVFLNQERWNDNWTSVVTPFKPTNKIQATSRTVQVTEEERKENRDALNKIRERNGVPDTVNW